MSRNKQFSILDLIRILGTISFVVFSAPASADHGGGSHIDLNLTVPATSSGDYTVSWTNVGNVVLQEKKDSGLYTTVYYGAGPSVAFTNQASGTYNYRILWVFCFFSCNTMYTLPETIVVSAVPPVPTGLTGPGTDYDGAYTINWNASTGATSYNLEEKLDAGAWTQIYSGASISKAVSGNAAGTYSYRVQACAGASICSAWSSTHITTVAAAPSVPTGLTGPATDPDGSYTISWNSSSGSTSYTLEEQLGAGSWNVIYTGSSLSKAINGNAAGTYTYRVKGCNVEAACSGWSSTHVVDVSSAPPGPATPPTPGPNMDPGQGSTAASDTIGTTAGNFRVDESGAATYSIPIAAAAGTAGVVPQVSLNYSSSAGNGIAGQGWSIGGLSAISRCRQTVDQDKNVAPLTWTNSDRFCLDGQRLLVEGTATYGAANSTYRTEIDSGVIVTAIGSVYGEPDYFEAKRKDGSISYYGKAPGSGDISAKLDNGANNTLTWSIRQFEDSVGNPIWFDYDTAGGVQRISQIKYALNQPDQVRFRRQRRPDQRLWCEHSVQL